jgi:hypothetical protein
MTIELRPRKLAKAARRSEATGSHLQMDTKKRPRDKKTPCTNSRNKDMHVCVRVCAFLYLCTYVFCTYVLCIHSCISVGYICIHGYMYVCMYVHVYICLYA